MSDSSDLEHESPAIDKSIGYIVYVLYVVGYLFGGAATLVGIVIAYIARRRESSALIVSHYSWQIRIFWWSFLAFFIAAIVMVLAIIFEVFTLIGVFVAVIFFVVIAITVVVLAIRGMLDLSKNNVPSERYVI